MMLRSKIAANGPPSLGFGVVSPELAGILRATAEAGPKGPRE